jgi:HSP20 family protein
MSFRFDPFADLHRFLDDPRFGFVDRAARPTTFARPSAQTYSPLVDVFEDEAAIVVRAELPGVAAEAVSVTVEKNVLTLEGERKLARGEKESIHRIESSYGKFRRVFTLPKSVEAEAIEAKLEHGVLTVRLPKRAETQPRKIAVKVETAVSA